MSANQKEYPEDVQNNPGYLKRDKYKKELMCLRLKSWWTHIRSIFIIIY